jgi:biopolymer transport protein ExbB
MIEFLVRGGVLIIPLLLLSVVALAVTIDRILSLQAKRVFGKEIPSALSGSNFEKDTEQILQICRRDSGPLAQLVSLGITNRGKSRRANQEALSSLARREVHELERGLVALEVIAGITPLLGLLGTVLGMVDVFDVIAVLGVGQASELSRGISEALVTTITGLSIAIPTLAAYNYFNKRLDSLVVELERYIDVLVDKLYPDSVADAAEEIRV